MFLLRVNRADSTAPACRQLNSENRNLIAGPRPFAKVETVPRPHRCPQQLASVTMTRRRERAE